jgi:hypothetical protein
MSPVHPAILAGNAAFYALAAALCVASLAISLAATGMVVVRLPADYFLREKRPLPFEGRSVWLRVAARVGLNLLGMVLIATGIVMSLPGVPGQGLLTILLGLMLVDIPGKRRVELLILRRKLVHRAVDRLRRRFDRAPLEIPERTMPG